MITILKDVQVRIHGVCVIEADVRVSSYSVDINGPYLTSGAFEIMTDGTVWIAVSRGGQWPRGALYDLLAAEVEIRLSDLPEVVERYRDIDADTGGSLDPVREYGTYNARAL